MTREQAKELLPIIQAYIDGKDIEYMGGQGWSKPLGNKPMFADGVKYRIKPTPTLRPWKPEEVPVGALLKVKSIKAYLVYLIVSCGKLRGGKEVTVVADGEIERHSLQYLFDYFEHSLDRGKTWHPCGVVVDK